MKLSIISNLKYKRSIPLLEYFTIGHLNSRNKQVYLVKFTLLAS